jgi:hypothetical protein
MPKPRCARGPTSERCAIPTLWGDYNVGGDNQFAARPLLRTPGLRSLCRIRTIWRRPPQGQRGIVSGRNLGTLLRLTCPHA